MKCFKICHIFGIYLFHISFHATEIPPNESPRIGTFLRRIWGSICIFICIFIIDQDIQGFYIYILFVLTYVVVVKLVATKIYNPSSRQGGGRKKITSVFRKNTLVAFFCRKLSAFLKLTHWREKDRLSPQS